MGVSAQVQTVTEKPGLVRVVAFASRDRKDDAKPIAGFFVRRRYAGSDFLLAKPEEFSPRWMRFVEAPPKEWIEPVMKICESQFKQGLIDKMTVDDLTKVPAYDEELMGQGGSAQVSMSQLADQQRRSFQMDGHGRITPRN